MSDQHFDTTLELRTNISQRLRQLCRQAHTWQEEVDLCELYGEFLATNLGHSFTDLPFQEEFARNENHCRPNKDIEGVIFYATNATNYGGHSRLFRNHALALYKRGIPLTIVSRTRSDTVDFLSSCGIPTLYVDLDELVRLRFRGDVYLYSHMHDIVSFELADQAALDGHRVLFVNHADHCFSFQPTERVDFIEVSGLGRSISEAHRKFHHQTFLGISIDEDIPQNVWKPANEPFLLTIARREKLRPRGDLNFPAFANQLSQKNNIPLVLVGQNGTEPWWRSYRNNPLLRFKGRLDISTIYGLISQCAAYVDSFPLTGGSVLPIVGKIGAPIFSIKSLATGYNVAETIKLAGQNELVHSLNRYLAERELHYCQTCLHEQIDEWHSFSSFCSRAHDVHKARFSTFPDWGQAMKVDATDVRNEFFTETRFPFELPAAISFKARMSLLRIILKNSHLIRDFSKRATIVSVIGKDEDIYRSGSSILRQALKR